MRYIGLQLLKKHNLRTKVPLVVWIHENSSAQIGKALHRWRQGHVISDCCSFVFPGLTHFWTLTVPWEETKQALLTNKVAKVFKSWSSGQDRSFELKMLCFSSNRLYQCEWFTQGAIHFLQIVLFLNIKKYFKNMSLLWAVRLLRADSE